jgi:hypothetical protein
MDMESEASLSGRSLSQLSKEQLEELWTSAKVIARAPVSPDHRE